MQQTLELLKDMAAGIALNLVANSVVGAITGFGALALATNPITLLGGCVVGAIGGSIIRSVILKDNVIPFSVRG